MSRWCSRRSCRCTSPRWPRCSTRTGSLWMPVLETVLCWMCSRRRSIGSSPSIEVRLNWPAPSVGCKRAATTTSNYARHADEALRDAQADVWMGFDARELEDFAQGAGLVGVRARDLPRGLFQNGVDGHLSWLLLSGKRPAEKQSLPA